ncbi:UNVERIFIED_CONTAM: hypothetical protein RMT77_007685 [Armadillidium vulgare]
MRSSINCCLVGLASFDAILLTTSLLMFGIPAIPEYTGAMIWYQRDVFPWVTLAAYPLGTIAQTGSVYLTVTVTVERYVAVCHPLKARSLCTYGRAKLYVIFAALFSFLYNFPRFWEVTYKIRRVRDFRMYRLRGGSEDNEVRLANNERQNLSRLQKKELGLAVMLLCVVIVFFLCNILAFIVNVLEMFNITLVYLTMISNLLVTINSSVNFIIYCIFGQKFRRLFLQIFCFGNLRARMVQEGLYGESGVAGNSIYGDGRNYINGRSTQTQSIRLSSWGGSNRINNSITWQRERMSVAFSKNSKDCFKNIPLQEMQKEEEPLPQQDQSIISPTEPLVGKDQKIEIV